MLESMIDVRPAPRDDPFAYRRKLLSKDARSIAALDRAGAIAGWGKIAEAVTKSRVWHQILPLPPCVIVSSGTAAAPW